LLRVAVFGRAPASHGPLAFVNAERRVGARVWGGFFAAAAGQAPRINQQSRIYIASDLARFARP
jgi:hypothetical protein